MTQTIQPPQLLRPPTIDVGGKVIYHSGTWGSKYPARRVTLNLSMIDLSGVSSRAGSNGLTDNDGRFKVNSGYIANGFSRITLEMTEEFTQDKFSMVLFPGLTPNGGFQDLGEIVFPFKPQHPELAIINSVSVADASRVAAMLSGILKVTHYPVSVELLSEWRATQPGLPTTDPTAGQPFSRVTQISGRRLDKPLSVKVPDDVAARERQMYQTLRREAAKIGPIPILTPAQKLLKMLSGADLPKDFPKRVVNKIGQRGIVAVKPASSLVDSIGRILDGLSHLTISQIETGTHLRRLVMSLQQAARKTYHFDSVIEEAAADMAACCVLIFLAGLAAKGSSRPQINLNYKFNFKSGTWTETRNYVKVSVVVSK